MKRHPEKTRTKIVEAAVSVFAEKGVRGLSISRVAKDAGFNRGTVYQYFATRELLIREAKNQISRSFRDEVFGEDRIAFFRSPGEVVDKLATFATKNPEFCKVWLYEFLRGGPTESDPFWQEFSRRVRAFSESDYAEPGIDVDIHALSILGGVFVWAVVSNGPENWDRCDSSCRRLVDELLRLSMNGVLMAQRLPEESARID